MVIGQEIAFDGTDNLCFGCSPHNGHGLQLRFTHVGPGRVEREYRAPAHTCGAPGVVHGGIQAVLLDEAIGFAIHAHDADDSSSIRPVVTVEFDLRYRRPVAVGAPLTLRGEVVRAQGRDYLAVGEILDADGEVLTSATARWRRLG